MDIVSFTFDSSGRERLKKEPSGSDWPVVYMIHDDEEAYIGETCSMIERMAQHLQNSERTRLEELEVLVDFRFNKSAVLDLEQTLIRHCGADGRFRLQNRNLGQSSSHDYYQREMYTAMLPDIWRLMLERDLARKQLYEVRNSNLFKYSPYTTLTSEQRDVAGKIMMDILNTLESNARGCSVIHGSAGTGKTVLAICLMFELANANPSSANYGYSYLEGANPIERLTRYVREHGDLRIGLVVPMSSLRKTLSVVFKDTGNGLKGNMVMGPSDVIGGGYDVLLVDESHRLSQRKNISFMGTFDNNCRNLGLDPTTTTQLDWIIRSCRHCVLFYDGAQTVKGSDITPEQFDHALGGNRSDYKLTSQLRCMAGDDYPLYIDRILKGAQPRRQEIQEYDIRLFDDVEEMVSSIRTLDSEMGLCRNVAGYSWKWISKGKSREEIERLHLEDIEIEGHKYIWNMENVEWIIRSESINEIGCIHTTQGYDLNYVGVIFGREIDYDEQTGRVEVDLSRFYDSNVKKGNPPEQVREYIINSYKVMMTRGIRGCYVYACNPGLRKYLERFL